MIGTMTLSKPHVGRNLCPTNRKNGMAKPMVMQIGMISYVEPEPYMGLERAPHEMACEFCGMWWVSAREGPAGGSAAYVALDVLSAPAVGAKHLSNLRVKQISIDPLHVGSLNCGDRGGLSFDSATRGTQEEDGCLPERRMARWLATMVFVMMIFRIPPITLPSICTVNVTRGGSFMY